MFLGNILGECNNFAGGMLAIYTFPGAENTDLIRISCCIGYAILVYGLLYWDKTHHLSVGLGIIMVAMAALFMVVVVKLGIDWPMLVWGLVPNFPAGSAKLILSLVGTTAIGYNIFLGSSLAKSSEQTLGSAQRGIAFSVLGTLSISMLIVIIGNGVLRYHIAIQVKF